MPADPIGAAAGRTAATCPVCRQHMTFVGPPLVESLVECPGCAIELEVVDTAPPVLAVAWDTGEDWGRLRSDQAAAAGSSSPAVTGRGTVDQHRSAAVTAEPASTKKTDG